jgi:hypothetical protein
MFEELPKKHFDKIRKLERQIEELEDRLRNKKEELWKEKSKYEIF